MQISTIIISGIAVIGTLGIGYHLYNSKLKHNSKSKSKAKESKQEQEVKISKSSYVPLTYVPKNTNPTSNPKPIYSSNFNQNHKSNNYVEDDNINKHSYHYSHSHHDSHDCSSHSSYDSGGSCDSGGCDCGGCD